MKLFFGHPGDQPDYHAYEALQIFGGFCGMPEFVPGQDRMWLRAEGVDGAGNGGGAEEIDGAENSGETEKIDPGITDFYAEIPNISGSRDLERHIYLLMREITGYSSPWGCLTGVRPTKIVNQLLSEGHTRDEVMGELTGFYMASEEKAKLAVMTALEQKPFLDEQTADPSRIGIYIGIPFCPSRCLYCSFTSNSIAKYKKSVDTYIDLLRSEMEATAEIVRDNSLKVESVYIGGGTPTSLGEEQFAGFISDVVRTFIEPSLNLREFSVEAGRPDSITEGKLAAMRSAGVNRISINPQSMNDSTLRLIGRAHTAEQTVNAFSLARSAGFDNINMDIICGLPGEDMSMFSRTLDDIVRLSPESVTVHTLSVKRAADLKRDERRNMLESSVVGNMVGEAASRLTATGMRPYYMYRQKNMLGNHENVAYCLPGRESPYNIHIMEEDQTILAAGAGGVSKFVAPGVIRRAFNVKSVEEYLARSIEMAERKRALFPPDGR